LSTEAGCAAAGPAPPDGPALPEVVNRGHPYADRVGLAEAGLWLSAFYAARHRHSPPELWRQRLAAGEIEWNGQRCRADGPLAAGDRLVWHRPPWREPAVPVLPGPVFDDGDLVAFAKPAGLPVLPAGGFLEHTLLKQIERQVRAGELDGAAGPPRPVHRLGRFTSGLLLCARRSASRAWLSARLRESTALHPPDAPAAAGCRKLYRALSAPLPPELGLRPGGSLEVGTPIGRRPHPRLGDLWCAAAPEDPAALAARSRFTLLEPRPDAALLEVEIATGRPHQIRIHAAALGAPLLGDPLYGPGGIAAVAALPGDGGYRLHAHRLCLPLPQGGWLELEAPPPACLRAAADG
jgi:23S rRNA pseudouridine1911/1915/1917 synthase